MSNEQPAEAETATAEANASPNIESEAKVGICATSEATPQGCLVKLLRARAQRHKRVGWIVLLMILAVIVLGSVAFWLSGQRSELEALAEQGDRIQFRLDAIEGLDVFHLGLASNDLATSIQLLQRRYDTGTTLPVLKDECEDALKKATKALEQAPGSPEQAAKRAEELVYVRHDAKEHTATLTELMKRNEGWAALVTTSSRLAIAALLLFLVQFLIVIYRYTVRLSSFYDSRADVLMLGTYSASEIISVLSPDSLEFGKAPKAPYESVADLVKSVAQSKVGEK